MDDDLVPPVRRPAAHDGRPSRTCVAELQGGVLVFGTVLPWHTDRGPSGQRQGNWDEFRRVVPLQGAEWLALRRRYPDHDLVVALDFNESLATTAFYGGTDLRRLLEEQCEAAGLQVLTGAAHERVPLVHPVIDHIAVSPGAGRSLEVKSVQGWEGSWDGRGRLSDHSAVVVAVTTA